MENKEPNKSVDFTSKFICTVYKPLYYIVLPLVLAFELELFTTFKISVNTSIIYWIIIISLVMTAVIEYLICKHIRIKRNNLNIEQLTFKKKIKHIIIIMSVTLILMIIVPFIHVYIISNL